MSFFESNRIVAAIVLVTIVWHAPSLRYGFFADDFEQIRDAVTRTDSPVLIGHENEEHVRLRMTPSTIGFFRPVLYVSFWLDARLFGAWAPGYHLSSILWHALTTVLFFRLLRQALSGIDVRVSAAAALVFGIHPGHSGAINWIAARGDILWCTALVGALLALTAYRRHRGSGWLFVSLALAVASSLSKETGLISPVILLLFDLLVLGRWSGSERRLLVRSRIALALTLPVPSLLRDYFVGNRASLYGAADRANSFEVVASRFGVDALETICDWISGYAYHEAGSKWHEIVFVVLALSTIALVLLSLRRDYWLSRLFLIIVIGVFLAPALRFRKEVFEVELSRLSYGLGLPLSLVVAAPFAFFVKDKRWPRPAAAALLIAHAVMVIHGSIRVDGDYARAARYVSAIEEGIAGEASTVPGDTAFVVVGLPINVGTAPLFFNFLSFAFVEPFRPSPLFVRGETRLDWYLARGEHDTLDHPLLLLRLDTESAELERIVDLLPAPATRSRTFQFADGEVSASLKPPAPARGIRAVEIELDGSSSEPFRLDVELVGTTGRTYKGTCRIDPKFGPTPSAVVGLDDQAGRVVLGGIKEVRVHREGVGAPNLIGGRLLDDRPTIAAHEPPMASIIHIEADEPRFVFDALPDVAFYRFDLIAPVTGRWTVPIKSLEYFGDDRLAFRMSMKGIGTGDAEPRIWSAERDRVRSALDRLGVKGLDFLWQITALRGQEDYGIAATAVMRASLER